MLNIKNKSLLDTNNAYCGNCNKVKQKTEFNLSKSTKNGVQTRCRKCQKEISYLVPKFIRNVKTKTEEECECPCTKCINRSVCGFENKICNTMRKYINGTSYNLNSVKVPVSMK